MAKSKIYKSAGQAVFQCKDHALSSTISWAPSYPQLEPPNCPSGEPHPMERISGDDPTKGLIQPPKE